VGLRERLGLEQDTVIVNDAVGALSLSTEDSGGVAAVLGTYCAVAGRNAAENVTLRGGVLADPTGAQMPRREGLAAIANRQMIELGPSDLAARRGL